MFGCQQVLIKSDKETQAILEYLCSESAKLSNCGITTLASYISKLAESQIVQSYTRFWEPRIRICIIKRSIRIQRSKF